MQKRILGLIITVCLLVSGAAALVPDQIDIVSSREWVVANGADTAVITVQVQNSSSSTSGLRVDFSTDPVYGQMTPLTGITDANGEVSSIFKAAQKSGIAPITVRIHYEDNEAWYTTEKTFLQGVDHDIPYGISYLNYLPEVAVGGTSVITVGLSDAHGNPIDNRNIAESVRFTVGSPSGNAGFDGASSILCSVNESGFVTATLKADTVAGENLVLVEPPSPIYGWYLTVVSTSNGIPFFIEHVVYPDSKPIPYQPADNESKFYLSYTLYDQFGNPTANRALKIHTSIDGEEEILMTSALGQVTVSYGPKDSPGIVTITATAVDNISVTAVKEVDFYDTAPASMQPSAVPLCMPSGDVREGITSSIRAKVMDIRGLGIAGEKVSFQILQPINVVEFNLTALPELANDGIMGAEIVEAVTDEDGYAVVQFHPGSFTTDRKAPGYNQTATGTCVVSAAWEDITRTVPLTWKNYPYITVETSFEPETIEVNDTVDVTVRLTGDGWALRNVKPMDVVLCIDRGEDMLLDETGVDGIQRDRMLYARQAAGEFHEHILGVGASNRVGLVTYGDTTTHAPYTDGVADIVTLPSNYNWAKNAGTDGNGNDDAAYVKANYQGNGVVSYQDYAEVWNGLNGDSLYGSLSKDVKTSLLNQVPLTSIQQGQATAALRKGLHTAIRELQENSREDVVKAVIVLMQNDYRYFGDPLARGQVLTGDPTANTISKGTLNYYQFNDGNSENMSRFASNNDVKIYVIYYSQSKTNDYTVPENLAKGTGGSLLKASNYAELKDDFEKILFSLMEEAGVGITMDLGFENVVVNTEECAGNEAFEYVYLADPLVSTRIHSYNATSRADIIPAYARDDTANWTADSTSLHFDVGTLRLNQVWVTSFRLRALKEGMVTIFGNNSRIMFNGGETLALPSLFLTVSPDLDNAPPESGFLNVSELNCTSPEPVTEFLNLVWNLDYTGDRDVTQKVFYSIDNGPWVLFDSMTGPWTASGSSSLDVRNLPEGEYRIRVHASALDAPPDWEELATPILVHISKKAYILLR